MEGITIETKKKVARLNKNECGEAEWEIARISTVKIYNVEFELEEKWEVRVGGVSENEKSYPEIIKNIKNDIEKLMKRGYEVSAVSSLVIKED